MKTWGSRIKWVCTAIALSAILLCCAVFSFVFLNNGENVNADNTAEQTEITAGNPSRVSEGALDSPSDNIITYYELDGTNNESVWAQAVTMSKNNNIQITVALTNHWNSNSSSKSFGTNTAGFLSGRIWVPAGANIILQLNGYNVNRNLTSATANGSVMYVQGTLEITDSTGKGEICGGNGGSSYVSTDTTFQVGGGIYVNGGTLTLSAGSISNNTATDLGGGLCAINSTVIMNGGFVSNNSSKWGGGVALLANSTLSMYGGTIFQNASSQNGGGVWCGEGTTLTISGGIVSGNTSVTQGAGIFTNGVFNLLSGKIVRNQSQNRGGGINLFDSTAVGVISGGEISENFGQQAGGFAVENGAKLTINNGTITKNTGIQDAGGIGIWGDGSKVILNEGVISNNKTQYNHAGGVYVYGNNHTTSNLASFTMNGGQITGNVANGQGGGLWDYLNNSVTITGGTIENNSASNGGGGWLHSGFGDNHTLSGGIIRGNTSNRGGGIVVNSANLNLAGPVKVYNNTDSTGRSNLYYISGTIKRTAALINNNGSAYVGLSSFDTVPKNIISNFATADGKATTFFFADKATNKIQLSGTTVQLVDIGTTTFKSISWSYKYKTDSGAWGSAVPINDRNLSIVYTGRIYEVSATCGSDTLTIIKKSKTHGSTFTEFKDVDTYTFVVNMEGYLNTVQTFEITKKEVDVNWSLSDFTYNGSVQYPEPTIGGVVAGDACTLVTNYSGAGTNVGNYTVSVSSLAGAQAGNYALPADGSGSKSYTISPKKLTKPYASGYLIYNGGNQLLIGGFDSATMSVSFRSGASNVVNSIQGKNADTYIATVSLKYTNNYRWEDGSISMVTLTTTIHPQTLSIAGVSLASKEYDGTDITTLDLSSLLVLGVVASDYGTNGEIDKSKIWIVPSVGGIVDENGKVHLGGTTAGRYTLKFSLVKQGSEANNYTLLSDEYECITYITRATIKVTGGIDVATDNNGLKGKVYDGTTTVNFDTSNAVIVYSANGNACSGVTVEAYGGYASSNAGSSVSALIWSLKLGGTLAANYELDVSTSLTALNNGTITGEITKKDVTAVITAGDCVYGGVPSVTYAVTGAVAGEDIKLALSYLNGTDSTTALKTAGVYTISAALTAEFANNYKLTSVTPDGGVDGDPVEVEITKAPLTITVYDAEVAFGGGKVNNGAFVTGLVWSDTRASLSIENGDLTFTYGDFDTDNGAVGSYVLSIDKTALSLANYTVTVVDGTLAVGLKNVTVTLTVTNGIYGGTGSDAASATASAALSDGTAVTPKINITYSGTSYDGTVYTNSTTVPVKPGEYTVVAAVDTASGYTGRATAILKIGKASLTVTVTAITAGTTDKVEYGTDITNLGTHFELSYNGWVNNDDRDSFGGTTATGDLDFTNKKLSTDYFRYAPIGTYEVFVSGVTSDNYEITFVSGTLTVEKANATVTVKNQSSVYNGSVPVAGNVTGIDYTVTGLKRSADDLGVSISIANAAKDAGVYDLEASASNTNYNVTFVGETASNTATDNSGVWTIADAFTVGKAKLTITAENKSIIYGDAAPAYTAVYEGFIGADGTASGPAAGVFTTELVLGCAYNQFDNVGDYDITEATAAAANNYYIVFVQGALTVEKKAIAVTIDRTKTTSEYGTTPIDFSVNTSNYYTFDTADLAQSTDDLQITLTHGVTDKSNAGTYVITAVSGNANYEVTFNDCVYTVEQFKLKVEWTVEDETGAETVLADGDVAEFEYNGASQGPKPYFIMQDGTKSLRTASGLQKNAGTGYTATVIIPNEHKHNYTFDASTSNTQAFIITARQLTVTWTGDKDDSGAFSYEFNAGIVQHPEATFGNVVAGETVTPVYVGATGMVGTNHTVEVRITDRNYSLPSNTTAYYNITKMVLKSFYWTSDGTTSINGSAYSYIFDGEAHMPTAKAGVSVTFSYTVEYSNGTNCGNRAVNAGEYTVTAVPSDSNYEFPAGSSNKFTFTIEAKEVKSSEVYYDTLTFVYTGLAQQPVFWYTDVNGAKILLDVTVNGDHVSADTYTAEIACPNDKNYKLTGGAASYNKQFTIAPKDIEVEWTLDGNQWVTDFVDDYSGNAVDYSATAKMLATYEGEFNKIGLKFEILKKDSVTGASSVWTGDIRDAGIYTLRAYVSDKTLADNYNVKEFSRQITIDKLPLNITVNGGNDYTLNYNDAAPAYTAVFNGFVPVYNDANGSPVDESVTVKAAVEAVEDWIFSKYIQGSQPGSYDVTLTTDSDKLKLLRQILRNYEWEQNFTGVKIIVNSITGTVLVLADNGTNEFVYDGTSKLPDAFYTPASGNGQQRKLEVSLLAVNPDGSDNIYLTDGKAVNVGTYYISVKRVSGDNDKTELQTEGLYFKIIKRTVIVKISDREADYGEVTQTNSGEHIVTEYLSSYGGRNGYLPLAADEAGLAINVECRFLKTDGTSNFDAQGYAQVGSYLIEGSWNKDAYSDNYEVIFVGGEDGENGQLSAGVFTINKADIIVLSKGDAFFEEYGDFDSSNPRYVIKLADKTDGVYNNIVYSGNKRAGNTDAKVTIKYVDKQLIADAEEPKHDAEYNLTDAPRITAAGEWIIYYSIEVEGGNHNKYYGAWRVQIKPEEDFIIVIFEKEFAVPYGEGVPEDLTQQLFDGGYYRLGNNAVSKEWFRDNATASVVGVTNTSEVGLYNIYFTINEGAVTGSLEYAIKYSDSNYTPETNIGKFRITQRLLTVEWSEESEFEHDGQAHLPELTLTGWIDGGTLTPDGVLANGERRYIYKDGNKEIVITVTATGDFKEIGGHTVEVAVGNSNYCIDVRNAVKSISIKSDTIVKYGHLPTWAWYAIGGAAAVLTLAIVILAVMLKRRKAVMVAGGDDDGFYDDISADTMSDGDSYDADLTDGD